MAKTPEKSAPQPVQEQRNYTPETPKNNYTPTTGQGDQKPTPPTDD